MQIKLILPSEKYKEQILAYKSDFIKNEDSMDGTSGLRDYETFEDWYADWKLKLSEETVPTGLVSATTFLAVDENDTLVGMIDLRHRLNEYLLQFGGHIGYSVTKTERKKGYATQMLALALKECKIRGINKALITCDKSNLGSAKTIIKNRGILENEVEKDGNITQRYWIEVV